MAKQKVTLAPTIQNDPTLTTKDLVIEIDLTEFELDDWEKLDPRIEGVSMKDVIDTLDKLVVGGVRGKGYKGLDLMQIQSAVGEALKQATNPQSAGKN